MQRLASILILGVCFSAMGHAAATAAVPVRVSGSRVNLRARPDMNVEVVGQIGADAVLMAKSFQAEWVEVVPPLGSYVWVHRDFVENHRVTAAKLNVRAGPGVNYSVVGTMDRGAPVLPKEEFGEWVKIDAPETCSFWVNIRYVERIGSPTPVLGVDPEAMQVAETASPTAPPTVQDPARDEPEEPAVPSVVGSDTGTRAEAAADVPDQQRSEFDRALLAKRKLVPLPGQGESSEQSGVLRASPLLQQSVSKFRLVTSGESLTRVVCHVIGNRDQLEALKGRSMRIKGRLYWIQASPYPVLIPESILLEPVP